MAKQVDLKQSNRPAPAPTHAAASTPISTKSTRQHAGAAAATSGKSIQQPPSRSHRKTKMAINNGAPSGGRKASMNHLLGFQGHRSHRREGDDDDFGGAAYSPSRARGIRHNHAGSSAAALTLSREEYIQANAHFYVRDTWLLDRPRLQPDTQVEWSDVVQVLYRSSEVQHCPICLGPPAAAQTTRCGHVYCWSCILHHLALAETAWAPCPLCDDFVYARDLRSAVVIHVEHPKPHKRQRLQLMTSLLETALVTPAHNIEAVLADPNPYTSALTSTKYLRFHAMEPLAQEQGIFLREALDLDMELTECTEMGSDPTHIKAAQAALRARWVAVRPDMQQATLAQLVAHAQRRLSEPTSTRPSTKANTATDADRPASPVATPASWVEAPTFVPGQGLVDAQRPTPSAESKLMLEAGDTSVHLSTQDPSLPFAVADASVPASVQNDGAGSSEDNPSLRQLLAPGAQIYRFYQADDGNLVFLHGVQDKMMRAEFGEDLAGAPERLDVVVEDVESVVVDRELRVRRPQFAHLPLHCRLLRVEVDLRSVVSAQTLDTFQEALQRRRRRRRQRDRDDEQRQRRFAQREEAAWRNTTFEAAPAVALPDLSEQAFPDMVLSQTPPSDGGASGTGTTPPRRWGPQPVMTRDEQEFPSLGPSLSASPGTSAFARGSEGPRWASGGSRASARQPDPVPLAVRHAPSWGTTTAASDPEDGEDDAVSRAYKPRAYGDSFLALDFEINLRDAAHLRQTTNPSAGPSANNGAGSGAGGQRRKKKGGRQKQILFAT
ncbi:uncharacterized protein MONBRDRAFT_26070 [Monosiga brevicollis MX1]|uniref:RING-type domain-containing protein n=1 Tax=Monosiga brevicollis TaxID=81824 RepID=A9V1A2_MONBE|nr:uncharacterized protein MONBRDRAFT_26070 [Monosiga brevicollis MX1]EDQ88772.1 predicted protein [Monosiga brevicollis MX1]|eukprot:XP_001746385.1 hypothetical protein [Monosiga brevicollis MX1]